MTPDRQPPTEYGLSLGSNLGDRLANLRRARTALGALPETTIVAASGVYQSEPVDVAPAFRNMPFLNAVLIVSSGLGPPVFARHVHGIEKRLGRRRTDDRNAPRPIDVDLIYAGELCLRGAELTLPHPRWHTRRFVVQPLADVRPDLVLHGQTLAVKDILLSLPASPRVVLYSEDWQDTIEN